MARTTIKTTKAGKTLSMDETTGAFYLDAEYLGHDGPVLFSKARADGFTHWVGSLVSPDLRVAVSAEQAAAISSVVASIRAAARVAGEAAAAARAARLAAAASAGDIEAATALCNASAIRASALVDTDTNRAAEAAGSRLLDEET